MSTARDRAAVRVDLRRPADHPLSKSKFAVFNSGVVPAATYRRDEAALCATRPESVRIDIGWGAEWMEHEHTVALADGVTFDFTDLDAIGSLLSDLGIRPYWSYCYVPAPFRRAGGDWRDLADDPSGWIRMVTAYVEGARAAGTRVGYHEVYNEPDLRDEKTGEAVFYGGDLTDYLALYRAAAPAIRAADPVTPVGGPALASVFHNEAWIPAFLDLVLAEHLPLDFFSFHHYGTHSIRTALDIVLRHLEERPALADVAVHLNEYNSYPVDYPRGGTQDGHHLAAALLADFHRLLAAPGLTKVSWAQFLDSGHGNYSGMIDIDGNHKPVYTAYRFYQQLPVDRYELTVDGPAEVGGFAAAEPGRAAVLLWNRSPRTVTAAVDITGWDGAPDARLRRLDAEHTGAETEELTGEVTLPMGGVVLIELGAASRAAPVPAGTVTRVRQHYPVRRTSAWADLDEASTTFRFGTADDPAAVPMVTADLTGCGERLTVHTGITGTTAGAPGSPRLTLQVTGSDGTVTGIPLTGGTTEVDLLGPDVSVGVAVHDAGPHTFATVRLSPR